jgi:nucleoside-diphosphate-sugar epimerase
MATKSDINIRLCITGGSGFIGTNAMEWAIKNSIQVMNIDIKMPKILDHLEFYKEVDIRDLKSLKYALEEFSPTHIIHLAATTGMDDFELEYFDANTVGVQNLISVSNQLKELERVIFTSSLLVCRNGYIPKTPTEFCPPNKYGESKVIGEKIVRAQCFKSWVIVRPTSIWGPWFETSYLKFFKTIKKGIYINPGSTPIFKPLSYVGNTVYMFERLLFSKLDAIEKNVFYLADYPYTSVQDWSNTISKAFGRAKVLVAPIFIMKIIALMGDVLKFCGFSDPPITSFRLKNILTGGYYPIENTKKIVGDLPFSMEKGVEKTVKWVNNNL